MKRYIYRIKRITADIDSLSRLRVYWCLIVFKLLGYRHETTVKISPSGHGRHVLAWACHKGLSREMLFVARVLAGDDRYRVKKDKGDRMVQILWDKKIPISELKEGD